MIRSMPISCTQHSSAGLEKFPLVVIQKLPQKTSRKLNCLAAPGRASAWSTRHTRNGNVSPRWPRMIFSLGYFSNTPESTMRMASVAVSTV